MVSLAKHIITHLRVQQGIPPDGPFPLFSDTLDVARLCTCHTQSAGARVTGCTYSAIILPTQFKQVADQLCRNAPTTNCTECRVCFSTRPSSSREHEPETLRHGHVMYPRASDR